MNSDYDDDCAMCKALREDLAAAKAEYLLQIAALMDRHLGDLARAEERGARQMAEYYCKPHLIALGEKQSKEHIEHSMRWYKKLRE
jgi:hypothetical protein